MRLINTSINISIRKCLLTESSRFAIMSHKPMSRRGKLL